MTDIREGAVTWQAALRNTMWLSDPRWPKEVHTIALSIVPPLSHADVVLWEKLESHQDIDVPPSIVLPFQRTYFDFGTKNYTTESFAGMLAGALAQSHDESSGSGFTAIPFIWPRNHEGFTKCRPMGIAEYHLDTKRYRFSPIFEEVESGEGEAYAAMGKSMLHRILEILTLLECGNVTLVDREIDRAARRRVGRASNGKVAQVVVMRPNRTQYIGSHATGLRIDTMPAHNVRASMHHVTCGPYFRAHPTKQWNHPTKGLGVSRFVPDHVRGHGKARPRIRRFADALG